MNELAVRLALDVARVALERDAARAELQRILGVAEFAARAGVDIHPAQILHRGAGYVDPSEVRG